MEWKLAGRSEELKESVLGVEVFGREAGYDPKRDPVVRTEASRLRGRLAEYYSGVETSQRLVIELPKGGYVPEWRGATVSPSLGVPRLAPREPWLQSRWAVLVGLVVVILVGAGWRWIETMRKPVSIAVLPLRNLSGSAETDFFSDGLTGEIIRNLSIIEGLTVRSQASSFVMKNKASSVRDRGKELAADYVLEGTVSRSGDQLRIQVQLVKVDEERYVWSERYDRDSSEVFKIQDEISLGIVNSLRLKLGNRRRRYETSVEAYDLYLKARALQINSVFGDVRSIDLFEQAIQKDAAFAPAYAGVAAAYAEKSEFYRPNLSDVEQDLARMRVTAEKAMELDPLLPEAREAAAMACARDGKWEQAEIHFHRALELDPNDSKLRSHYGCNYFMALGRVEEALEQLRIAERNDPLSPQVHYRLGFILLSAKRFDEAIRHCELMRSEQARKNSCLGRALLWQGRLEEALPMLKTAENLGYLGYALAHAGRKEEAAEIYAKLPPHTLARSMYWAGLGDQEALYKSLLDTAWAGPVLLGRVLTFPEFDLLRGDARMAAVHRAVGLPE